MKKVTVDNMSKQQAGKNQVKVYLKAVTATGLSLALIAGCTTASGQSPFAQLFAGNNSTNNQIKNFDKSNAPYTGEVNLEIDPSLLGEKYKGYKKVKILSDGGFSVKAASWKESSQSVPKSSYCDRT